MKDVSYYRTLPFTRRVDIREDRPGDAYFIAWIEELPGLRIDGSSPEEALMKLDETFDDWMEVMIEAGEEIPEPEPWPGNALTGQAQSRTRAPGASMAFTRPSPRTTTGRSTPR